MTKYLCPQIGQIDPYMKENYMFWISIKNPEWGKYEEYQLMDKFRKNEIYMHRGS